SLSASAENGYEFVNWTDADGEVSTEADFDYTMPAENLTLTANYTEETTSIDPSLSGDEFKIYPNPTEGRISVKTDNPEGSVHIHNLTGKIIFKKHINKEVLHIDLSGKPSGIYFIKIITDTNTFTKKLILN
ncbi:MAG: T9SS type A sorting domain-containing protein, partial [Bacteroidota bacterium]